MNDLKSRRDRRGFLKHTGALALGAALPAAGARAADAWPSKPIRLVVGYAPGGVADITARMVAEKVSAKLGQQIIIDNRPGAGGIVAADLVAKSDPDGYNLLHLNQGNAVSAALFRTLPFDIIKDFDTVSAMGYFTVIILANQGSSVTSVQELLRQAKANPSKFNIGTISVGSGQNMAASLFKAVTGTPASIVPFKSTPSLISALKGGDVQVAFEIGAPVLAMIRHGDVKAVAVTAAQRYRGLPDVPTVKESGVPNYDVIAWNGVAAPKKTPRAIIERLNREINAAMALPDIKQKFGDFGIEARGGTPEEFHNLVVSEVNKWTKVVAETKMEKL
ncbi:MAG TPA: tripartite tricarboxylate transporter substrate binding protein [Burkholderiales bacterium]